MTKKLLYYNILPVLAIHLILLPLWFIHTPFFEYNVSLGEMLINLVVVPLYLIILNFRYAVQEGKRNFFPYMATAWGVTLASNAFSYLNWGLATGRFFSEGGTFDLFQLIYTINFVTILILGFVVQLALGYLDRRTRV